MESLGRYLLLQKLAVGGMAEVYRAKLVGAAGFEKEVAVKKILPQWSRHQEFVAMMIDEAKIAVRLSHPNLVEVYELAREGEAYYIAMEYVPGRDVRSLMQAAAAKKVRIPEDAALFMMTEVLEGLSYAHGRRDAKGRPLRIVHRDISPQNILISGEGAVKITDFGIAKAASKTHETATGVLKGKFAYMSPEQASQGEIDGRSDLFSAAVVLFEMLTGERLFYCGSDIETLDRVRRAEAIPSAKAKAAIPEGLWAILNRALSRFPGDRYADAAAFRDALQSYARAAGLSLNRDRLVQWMRGLFAGEKISEDTKTVFREDGRENETCLGETRLFTQAKTLIEGGTKTERETLADRSETRERKTAWAIAPGIAGFVFLAVVLVFALSGKRGPPPLPSPETVAAVVVASSSSPETQSAPSAERKIETPPVVALKPEIPKVGVKGYLSVQAVPWGTVTVDGGKRRWQTPVRRLPLGAGRHTVRVAYEPDGSVLSAPVVIAAGKEIVCVAKFRGGKELRCGK